MVKFEDKNFKIYTKISDILFLLPSIMCYIEREQIEDANALAISLHWLVFQLGFFIKLNNKK